MNTAAPSLLKPALIGGAAFGILGAIPGLQLLNCACCSLVIGSGFLAAFLYSKDCRKSNVPFSGGGGAKIGVVAGVFYLVFSWLLTWLIGLAMGRGFGVDEIMKQIENNPQIPAETADKIAHFLQSGGLAVLMLVSLIVTLVFSTIGGLIGGAVFKVQPPPPVEPPAQVPQM